MVGTAPVGIARCEGDFLDRDCSISLVTGDLTLGSVRIEDEGLYVCRKSFRDGISDSKFRLRQLNVNGKMFVLYLYHFEIDFEPLEIRMVVVYNFQKVTILISVLNSYCSKSH